NFDAPQARWVASGNQARLQIDHADPRVPLYLKTILFSSFVPSVAAAAAHASAVDGAGNVYLTARTMSAALPDAAASESGDIFVTKLNKAGVAYTTYLGGAGADQAWSVAVDDGGNVYVAGDSSSADFPLRTTPASGMDAVI